MTSKAERKAAFDAAWAAEEKRLNDERYPPGTPAGRWHYLLTELDKRFPDPEPWSARAPEGRYLAMIDEMIARDRGILTGDVIVESWAHVKRIMNEFKKRRNKGFHLEVEEVSAQHYRVKVYKAK